MTYTKEPVVESPTNRQPGKDTFRILIMDTPEHTELLKTACKEAGHAVVAAHSIAESFAFLDDKDHADVIVCAAYLEDESLFDFLGKLRNHPTHQHSRFMILALEPGPAGVLMNYTVEIAGKALGADAFVRMPVFDADKLVSEIDKLLPNIPSLERSRIDGEL